MHEVLTRIEKLAVVPTIVLADASHAEPLAEALIDGGLPCAEVTLRTPASLEILKRMAGLKEDFLVGAGTVLNPAQADEAIAAGAKFIVSPGMDAALIRHCQAKGIPILPGACTPTEVMLGLTLGLDCVKFFPSHAYGGLTVIKALHGPFPQMRFMPTGGVTRESVGEYLGFKPVLAVGGTWMVRKEWLDNERYDIISDACMVTRSTIDLIRRSKPQEWTED
jgi:2-dehydro-3-deoxyphosphogluconate aldolase/(4S)-4-hydroxy-2-oxoglutarate aldolase